MLLCRKVWALQEGFLRYVVVMVAQNFTLKIVNMVSGFTTILNIIFCFFENFIYTVYFGHTHHSPPRLTLYPSTNSQLSVLS